MSFMCISNWNIFDIQFVVLRLQAVSWCSMGKTVVAPGTPFGLLWFSVSGRTEHESVRPNEGHGTYFIQQQCNS